MESLHQKIEKLGAPLVLLLAVGAAAALIAISEYAYSEARQATDRMQHNLDVRTSLNTLYRLVLDAETGQRGYLLTGNETYLAPYNEAVALLTGALDQLRDAVVINDRTDLAEISPISRMVSKKLAEMEIAVTLRQRAKIGDEQWRVLVETNAGKGYMDALRSDMASLLTKTNERVVVQRQRINRALTIGRVGLVLGAITALASFILFLRQMERARVAEQNRTHYLEAEKERLDRMVTERTRELGDLATRLQTVEEKEKEELARELHDELGSLLTAAKLDLARLKTKLAKPIAPEVHERIKHLSDTLNDGIALKRRIIEDLRPSALNNLGLLPTIETLLADYSARTSIPVATDINAVALSPDSNLAVFRVLQESLTNITKYARAKEVSVSLRSRGNYAELVITDDGIGFDMNTTPIAAHGLAGMRHRMQALHGNLDVKSAPNMGTTIKAYVPLDYVQQDAAT